MRRVVVSLSFIPATTPALTAIKDEFNAHLPLQDLRWRSSSRNTVRTIDNLQLEFKDLQTALADSRQLQIPLNLLDKPYLYLLFLHCDDNEVYRTQLRPKVKEWIDSLQARKQQEWLIVHVTNQKLSNSTTTKFYLQRKGSVLDKIKADFNTGKRDRCCQIALSSGPNNHEAEVASAWTDLLARVKESIVASFDLNFSVYEEDVRRINSNRELPGWNFCTFFIQKEGLAHSFEAMNLLEDALIQYDELEASYSLGTRAQSLPWFRSVGGMSPGDDSLDILSFSSKPFRDLIIQNNISIFDFRIYLFARQAALTIGLGRIGDLAKRGKEFIYGMYRFIQAHGGAMPRGFLEAFTFAASQSIVQKCRELLGTQATGSGLNPAIIPDLLPTLSDLMELSVRQLEKLGIVFEYLPLGNPLLLSANTLTEEILRGDDGDLRLEYTHPLLKRALSGVQHFDEAYRSLLMSLQISWSDSLRPRNAERIKLCLAALDEIRQDFGASELRIAKSPYLSNKWPNLEAEVLGRSTLLQNRVGKYREELLGTLALIKAELASAFEFEEGKLGTLFRKVKDLSKHFDKDFAVSDFPTFETGTIAKQGHLSSDAEGVELQATIGNRTGCMLEVDEIRLKLVNGYGEALWLTSGAQALTPGDNIVTVTALTCVVGSFFLELVQVRAAHVVFQYSHKTLSSQQTGSQNIPKASQALPSSAETLVTSRQAMAVFHYDPEAVTITAEETSEIYLDRPRVVTITLDQGRVHISQASLKLEDTPSARLSFLLESATVLDNAASLRADGDKLVLSEIHPDADVRISVPFRQDSNQAQAEIPLTLEYCTTSRPTIKRVLRSSIHLKLALPLAVNVQDFLKPDFIVSKFTISTATNLNLRVEQVLLSNTPRYAIVPCVKQRSKPLTVTESQPATLLFRMSEKSDLSDKDALEEAVFKLTVKYRSFEDEALHILQDHLKRYAISSSAYTLPEAVMKAVARQIWVLSEEMFQGPLALPASGHALDLGRYNSDAWKGRLSAFMPDETTWQRWDQCLRQAYHTRVSLDILSTMTWKSLTIPFDIPTIAIHNRMSLDIVNKPEAVFTVGELVEAKLNIHTSFKWASRQERQELEGANAHHLLYRVHSKTSDWLVSGRTAGSFPAIDGNNHAVPLTLIPVRMGKIFLPAITIQPIPSQTGDSHLEPFSGDQRLPTCETDYENAAVSVDVAGSNEQEIQVWINA